MTSGLHVGRFRIEPGEEVHLDRFDPDDTSGFDGKSDDERDESKRLNEKLRQLQEMLYAEHRMKVLVILQAVDTGGKDGVIHRVFEGVNPQGVQVAHFGIPSPEELDHGFLWRHHERVPGKESWLSSTGATMKVSSSREFTSLCPSRSGNVGTERSMTSKDYSRKKKR